MEVLRLMSFLEGGLLDRAYLLLAGNGWSLKGHFFRSPIPQSLLLFSKGQGKRAYC